MFSKFMRLIAATVIAATAISLGGCSSSSGLKPGTEISIGELQGLESLNPDVASSSKAQGQNADLGLLTSASFYTPNDAGDLVANTDFGTVKLVSKFPFTVSYSLTGAAVWSDGTKVDATDLLLSWLAASHSEKFGFDSVRANSGLRFATAIPKLSTDLKTLTVQYTRPVTDWRNTIYPAVAAHTLAQKAFPSDKLDARAAKSRFVQDVNTSNDTDLAELGRQYVAAYSLAKGAKDPTKFLVGAGPYLVESADAVEGVKLRANDKFTWGNLPLIEIINVRYYEDSLAMIADIQLGKLDLGSTVESGSAQTQQIGGVAKKAGLNLALGLSQNIDAIRLNLAAGSIFSKASGNADKAAQLRQAFMLAVPKARIVAAINNDYSVQNAQSFFYAPGAIGYTSTVKDNHSSSFAFQDLEAASEILVSAGATQPIVVRVLFDSTNPRQNLIWNELSKFSKQIGFEFVDAKQVAQTARISDGDYDVSITQQALFSVSNFASLETVSTEYFASESFTSLVKKLAVTNKPARQHALAAQLDSALFAEGYGLPLYQVPTMLAYSTKVTGVSLSPFGNSAFWSYWNWQKAAK
ncbi:MAG: ABC transporter substrate-binding protein [Actinomycetes bacterium]